MGKPVKVKAETKYTRAQAEKLLAAGTDPSQFADHPNIHVLKKSWVKMGQPESHNYVNRAKTKAAERAAVVERAAYEAAVIARAKETR